MKTRRLLSYGAQRWPLSAPTNAPITLAIVTLCWGLPPAIEKISPS